MNLVLNIYTDETLTDVKRVAEADSLVIPYRVSMWLLENLDSVKIGNNFNVDDGLSIMKFIGANTEQIEKIIKATFKVSNSELECIDTMEIVNVMKELYKWAIEKLNGLGGTEKNA